MGGELSRGAGRSIRTSTGFDGAGCPTAIAASGAVRLVLEVSAARGGRRVGVFRAAELGSRCRRWLQVPVSRLASDPWSVRSTLQFGFCLRVKETAPCESRGKCEFGSREWAGGSFPSVAVVTCMGQRASLGFWHNQRNEGVLKPPRQVSAL